MLACIFFRCMHINQNIRALHTQNDSYSRLFSVYFLLLLQARTTAYKINNYCHISDNVTGGRDAIITVWLINIHYWQFHNLIIVRIQAIIWNLMNMGCGFLNQLSIGYNNSYYKGTRIVVIRVQEQLL